MEFNNDMEWGLTSVSDGVSIEHNGIRTRMSLIRDEEGPCIFEFDFTPEQRDVKQRSIIDFLGSEKTKKKYYSRRLTKYRQESMTKFLVSDFARNKFERRRRMEANIKMRSLSPEV